MARVAIVGTVGLPACYGGFETLVENLIGDNGEGFEVFCSSKSYKNRPKNYKGAELTYIPLHANGAQSILYDILSLICTLFTRPKAVLILGVSGCVFLPVYRLLSSARVVTNIDGLEWRREKWGPWAKRFLKLSEHLAVKHSDLIISDNKAIADYVRNEYGVNSTVIAYGGDHALTNNVVNTDTGYALALCRIEPENNVSMILEAFSKAQKPIKFVGNWDNSEFGRALKEKYSAFDNIEIVDPIYDIEALSKLRAACSYYVHGHSAGGTNPSLVEMMHFEKSIYCFDCDYNRASTEELAEFFDSTQQLESILGRKSEVNNASLMREIAQRRYTWKIVRSEYFSALGL